MIIVLTKILDFKDFKKEANDKNINFIGWDNTISSYINDSIFSSYKWGRFAFNNLLIWKWRLK